MIGNVARSLPIAAPRSVLLAGPITILENSKRWKHSYRWPGLAGSASCSAALQSGFLQVERLRRAIPSIRRRPQAWAIGSDALIDFLFWREVWYANIADALKFRCRQPGRRDGDPRWQVRVKSQATMRTRREIPGSAVGKSKSEGITGHKLRRAKSAAMMPVKNLAKPLRNFGAQPWLQFK